MSEREKRIRIVKYSLFFGSTIIALIVALSSLWLSRVFYSPDRLSDIATTALAEQSSRDSIGRAVSDRVFEDRPVLNQVAGPRLASLVSSVLGTDFASNTVDSVVERLRVALTTSEDETIAVNLTGIKDVVVQVQSVIGVEEDAQRINAESIPDELVLFESSALPDIHRFGIFVLWLGPVAVIFAFGGLSYWVYRGRHGARELRIKIAGLTIMTASVLAWLMGPLIEPVFVSLARDASGQTLLSNLYDGLITPFANQAIILFAVGLLILATGFLLPLIQKKPASNINKTRKNK